MLITVLCGLAVVYFMVVQPIMSFYSFLLYLERPPGELNSSYVFAKWASESWESMTQHTSPFSFEPIPDVFEHLEYSWSFERTIILISVLTNILVFIHLLGEIRLNRRLVYVLINESCTVSGEAGKGAAVAAATSPVTNTMATQTQASSLNTGHCSCCSKNKPSDNVKPISASVAGCKKATKKTNWAADDGKGPHSSPGASTGEEVTVTRSFSPSELRELRKDYTRKDGENMLTWMLRCWDDGADTRTGGRRSQTVGIPVKGFHP